MHADESNVERLVTDEAAHLLAYFTRRVAQPADAGDLLGETLLVIWRRVDDLPTDPTGARMWMYGVASRVLAGHRRGQTRRTALTSRLRDELAAQPPVDRDTRFAVDAALAQLDPVDAEIVRLVHWEGFTQAQIATILRKRPGTVRSRYHRARQRLAALLAEPHDGDGNDDVAMTLPHASRSWNATR